MDATQFPEFMQMQLTYMQQMQTYMEQCHQYAQQAAQSAGWNGAQPPPNAPPTLGISKPAATATATNSTDGDGGGTVLTYIQQQHEELVAAEEVELPEDEELVEPNPVIDVVALNQQIIDLDDKLFFELEVSRWCPALAAFGVTEQRPIKVRREPILRACEAVK